MPTPLKIPLPLKGVNRYGARSEQPLDTTNDALNVVPFDRFGRMRLGQRGGTGKLWSAAIGSGNPIQMVQQTVASADPASLDDNATLLNEPFTYSNGALQTVSSTAWTTYNNSFVLSATSLNVASNHVTTNTGDGATLYTTTPSVGSTYIVRADFIVQEVGATLYFGLVTRSDGTNNNRLTVLINLTAATPTVKLVDANGANAITPDSGSAQITTLPANYFSVGQTYTTEIQWSGNNYVVKINNATLFSGTTTLHSGSTKLGFLIQASTLNQVDNFKVLTGTPRTGTPAGFRQTDIVAVSNGSIYMGNVSSQAVVVGGGTSAFLTTTRPSGAAIFSKMYLVDGFSTIKKLNLLTRIVETYTTSGGSETTTTLGQYTLACVWRGRLVLAADRYNAQNFIMSKVGDPLNWDYTGTGPDTAFAGNASKAGLIGDPITALMPASDDILMIGGDHQLWRVTGDPADGGSINMVSDAIGVLGSTAWTKSPEGVLYFVGTTGLFRVAPNGGVPEMLSSTTYNQFFTAINRSRNYVTLAWDRDNHGCHIYVTPTTSGTATHLFYDSREGGLWPIQYPDSHGPISAAIYDGDNPTDRYVLLGGRTGYVQILSNSNRRDDGTAITSRLSIGPIQPVPPDGDSIVTGLELTTGEVYTGDDASVWNLNWTIKGGKTAYEVTDGTARRTVSGNLATAGYQNVRVPRTRGGWFTVGLSNSNDGDYFSLETVALRVEASGVQR